MQDTMAQQHFGINITEIADPKARDYYTFRRDGVLTNLKRMLQELELVLPVAIKFDILILFLPLLMLTLPTFTSTIPNIGTNPIEVDDDLNVEENNEQDKSLDASRDCEDDMNEGWPNERQHAPISTCWGR
jgi:hypothetical protein